MDDLAVIESIILVSDVRRLGGDLQALRRAHEQRRLYRLRRGVYCARERWESWSDRERHVARVAAASRQADNGLVAAGLSAAAVWRMPIRDTFPDEVIALDRYRGGGRSEPGVRRLTRGAATARTVTVGGLAVTDVARTALDVARGAGFADAVGSVDWALSRRNAHRVDRDRLRLELERLAPRDGRRHLAAVIEFATDLSDSFGESRGRAVIHECSFEPPELQLELRDAEGLMIADYAWPGVRVLGEFDGEAKFTDARYSGGDPLGKLRAQRRREARLRHLGWTVVRLEWADLDDPTRVIRLLADAGVPRRESWAPSGSNFPRLQTAAPAVGQVRHPR